MVKDLAPLKNQVMEYLKNDTSGEYIRADKLAAELNCTELEMDIIIHALILSDADIEFVRRIQYADEFRKVKSYVFVRFQRK